MHSVWWELAATVIPTTLGLGLALLARAGGTRGLVSATLIVPVLLPATVVASVWVLVYSPLSGLLNTVLRDLGLGRLARGWLGDPHLVLRAFFVAWLWSAIGVGTLIVSAGLRSIGREYLELAAVEGASPIQRFRYVLFPGVRRALVLAALVNAALAAQVFDLIFSTTGGGPGNAAMLIPLDEYGRAFGGRTGQGAAVACVFVLVCIALAVIALTLGRSGEGLSTGEERDVHPGGLGRTIAAGVSVAVALLMLMPLGWLLLVALGLAGVQPGAQSAGIDPQTWVWGNLGTAWNAGMGGAVETSLLLALGAVVLAMVLAAPAAFCLATLVRSKPLRYGIGAILVAGLFQPTPVLIIPLFSLLRQIHLLDSVWGVILPEVARDLPFTILILWGFLAQLPRHVLEAAEIDGAGPLRRMAQVALPLARPALVVVAIWAFVTSWNEYLLPTLVSQDGSLQTVPTLLGSFIGHYDTQYGPLAAGALIATAPSLMLYLAARGPAGFALSRLGRRPLE